MSEEEEDEYEYDDEIAFVSGAFRVLLLGS